LSLNECVVLLSLQKFMFYVLKSSDVLDVLVPILYFLNDARSDQCTIASHLSTNAVHLLFICLLVEMLTVMNVDNVSTSYRVTNYVYCCFCY